MMASAKGYRELIADLASERRRLNESEMCRSDGLRPQITQGRLATNLT
jgi:hypothetical protein